MQIHVNGKPLAGVEGETLAGLLERLKIPADRVAIEYNRVIIRREQWAATMIAPDAQIEIVHFVGGGLH